MPAPLPALNLVALPGQRLATLELGRGAWAVPAPRPALMLVALPGQRLATLERAGEMERRGFPGLSGASPFGPIARFLGLALTTRRIPFATAIAPIYAQTVEEFAQS